MKLQKNGGKGRGLHRKLQRKLSLSGSVEARLGSAFCRPVIAAVLCYRSGPSTPLPFLLVCFWRHPISHSLSLSLYSAIDSRVDAHLKERDNEWFIDSNNPQMNMAMLPAFRLPVSPPSKGKTFEWMSRIRAWFLDREPLEIKRLHFCMHVFLAYMKSYDHVTFTCVPPAPSVQVCLRVYHSNTCSFSWMDDISSTR